MKIALIHDWLRVNAGSEKVVKEIISTFIEEELELYTLFNTLLIQDQKSILQHVKTHISWLQYIPNISNLYTNLLPIMPFVIHHMNIHDADIYISSSHAVAKGFSKPKGKLHICYCHTPMRYAWYMNEDYLKDIKGIKLYLIQAILPLIRKWDLKSAQQVDYFIANSKHIQHQIKNIYNRESIVIYPPVDTQKFKLNKNPRNDFYLAVGRFVPYKKIDIIIQAFKKIPDKKLVLIGDGYGSEQVKSLLQHTENIVWLGYQHDDELLLYMQNAKACLFAAKEDFGIMCVEVQATGTPVLALNYGGYKETVLEGKTGYFFETQHVDSIINVVNKFEQQPLQDFENISIHAQQFSKERFRKEYKNFIIEKYNSSK